MNRLLRPLLLLSRRVLLLPRLDHVAVLGRHRLLLAVVEPLVRHPGLLPDLEAIQDHLHRGPVSGLDLLGQQVPKKASLSSLLSRVKS